MVHCGYEPTAADDAIKHPLKALMVALRGPRTEGPMVADIPLDKQRPAEYVFEANVQKTLSQLHAENEARRKIGGEAA